MRFRSTSGAFFNSVFLLALALSIFLQSIERFIHIAPVNSPFMMMVIGCVGLGLNILSAFFAHGKCHNATIYFNSPDQSRPQNIMIIVMVMVMAIAIVCTVIVMLMSAMYTLSN